MFHKYMLLFAAITTAATYATAILYYLVNRKLINVIIHLILIVWKNVLGPLGY